MNSYVQIVNARVALDTIIDTFYSVMQYRLIAPTDYGSRVLCSVDGLHPQTVVLVKASNYN